MSKPWDKLRVPPKQTKPHPIGDGEWATTSKNVTAGSAWIAVEVRDDRAALCIRHQKLDSSGLRELAEFCVELADQLEGK